MEYSSPEIKKSIENNVKTDDFSIQDVAEKSYVYSLALIALDLKLKKEILNDK